MKKKKRVYLFFKGLMIFFIILILVLVLIQQKVFKIDKEEKFQIKDNCQVILNSLIHPIKSEGECRIKCENECGLKEKKFVDSTFTENLESCNECECVCK